MVLSDRGLVTLVGVSFKDSRKNSAGKKEKFSYSDCCAI